MTCLLFCCGVHFGSTQRIPLVARSRSNCLASLSISPAPAYGREKWSQTQLAVVLAECGLSRRDYSLVYASAWQRWCGLGLEPTPSLRI